MKYRFYKQEGNQKWYLMPIKNYDAPAEFCLDLPGAGRFTEAEWLAWGSRYECEPIGEDEASPKGTRGVVRLIGAPTLPGFEITERTRWPGE